MLLEIADLKVHFDIKDGKQWFWQPAKTLKAVDGVTLRLYEGETLGVVGESGCGKSTFARAIIGLVKATDGKVAWLGKDLLGMKPDEWRDVRSDIQMIFQDPLASLNPRMDHWRNHCRAAAHLSSEDAAPGNSRSGESDDAQGGSVA